MAVAGESVKQRQGVSSQKGHVHIPGHRKKYMFGRSRKNDKQKHDWQKHDWQGCYSVFLPCFLKLSGAMWRRKEGEEGGADKMHVGTYMIPCWSHMGGMGGGIEGKEGLLFRFGDTNIERVGSKGVRRLTYELDPPQSSPQPAAFHPRSLHSPPCFDRGPARLSAEFPQ